MRYWRPSRAFLLFLSCYLPDFLTLRILRWLYPDERSYFYRGKRQ